MNSVLAARGLVKTYGDVHALAGVDIDIKAGDVLAVVGPSGSGKTTLLHVLSGILRSDGGDVFLDGRAIGELNETGRSALRRTAFGFVFQSGMLVAELTAEENAALPMLLAGGAREESLGAARLWLSRLGLQGLEKRLPSQLSGGQAQRVAIARALAHRPRVIFADEPTGALDTRTGQEMMTALLQAAEETGAAVVIVTHDKAIADRALRVVEIQDGKIAHKIGTGVSA
ncbi:ABC transporter ATP-binding protein [Lentzea sp. NPDC058436]|uniref:ABC transporter ATP-binding protein n=1 Tax=Lentzea sp. NPDC058436 TaxID=3346499 RepID=UPI0036573957